MTPGAPSPAAWRATFRSPPSASTPPGAPLVLWVFAGRALLVEPPEAARPLGPWAAVWYAARRDANLLLLCPVCDAAAAVTSNEGPAPGRRAGARGPVPGQRRDGTQPCAASPSPALAGRTRPMMSDMNAEAPLTPPLRAPLGRL